MYYLWTVWKTKGYTDEMYLGFLLKKYETVHIYLDLYIDSY